MHIMQKMQIEQWNVDRIKPYEKNPRINDNAVEAVANSLKEFGFRQPLVVDSAGVLIVGHTRWKAAKSLGLETVPVHVATDMTAEQVRAYRIADNKTGELADWDYDLLPIELGELQQTGYDLGPLGFTQHELSKLLDSAVIEAGDPETIPDPPAEPITKPGDIWQMGNHRLLCGDATGIDTVARLFAGETAKAELCFTSPPYNAGENNLGGNRNMVESKYVGQDDNKTPEEYLDFLTAFTDLALEQCQTVMVNLQMIANNKRTIIDYLHRYRDHFVDKWAWYKPSAAPAYPPNVLTSALEDVFIFSPKDKPSRAIKTANFDRGTLQNVYTGNTAAVENDNCKVHAATMPLHLAEHALKNFSRHGATVYEPFAGTGTTFIAAERLGRVCLGVELEPLYCDVIVKRWEQFTGKKAEPTTTPNL